MPPMKLVWDQKAYMDAGGKDKGDNSQFWAKCEIIKTYYVKHGYDNHGYDYLAVVRFPDGRVSKGHFVDAMREIPIKAEV